MIMGFENNLPVTLGERIAYLRKRTGLTQAQLAEQLDISAQAVSKWESQVSCPDIATLVPLAKIFGVSTDVLLGAEVLIIDETVGLDAAQPSADAVQAVDAVQPSADTVQSNADAVQQNAEAEKPSAPEEDVLPVIIPEIQKTVHTLFIELGAAKVRIEAGTSFHLEAIGYQAGSYTSRIENGIWSIRDKSITIGMGLRILGGEREMVVTIPVGHHFRSVHLSVGAGELTGTGITADTSKLDVGAGQMKLYQFHSGSTVIDCGMGNMLLDGSLSGRCKLDCGMGNVEARLDSPGAFGYKVDLGIGEVRIGENKFSGIGGQVAIDTNAKNFFDVHCGIGNVKLTFVK